MDTVYLVKKTATNIELKYSLRSLMFLPHNKVFIVGDLPDFINKNVFYIPAPKFTDRYKTTTNHIKLVCDSDLISDDFILMNDDFFILDQINDPESELNLNRGVMQDQINYYHKNHKNLSRFDNLVEQANSQLKKLNFKDPISFELHTPMIINKLKFKTILPVINTDALHCCKRSVYGNYFIENSKTIDDVKVLSYMNFDKESIKDRKLLSVSDYAWNKIETFLQEKFPNKSIYEK